MSMGKQLCHFIIYELSDGVRTGYAIFCTRSKAPHKVAIQKANDVDWHGLEYNSTRKMMDPDIVGTEKDLSMTRYEYPFLSYGVNCDRTMIELLLDIITKISTGEYTPASNNAGDAEHYGITEHLLKFFLISKYIEVGKRKDVLDAGWEVFQAVHDGQYQDEFRYTYVVPTPTQVKSWDPDLDLIDDSDYGDEDESEEDFEEADFDNPRTVNLSPFAVDFLEDYIPEALQYWNPDDVLTAIYDFIFEHGMISWIDGYNKLGVKAQEVYDDVLRSNS